MKRSLFLLINIIFIGILSENFAQNSLWLINGKKLTIGNYEIIQNEEESILKYRTEKGKSKKYELLDVFSVTNPEGKETTFHKEDLFEGISITEKQLRFFVEGQYDARMDYTDKFAFISSFPVGFVSIFYPPFSKIFFFPVYSSIYIGVLGITGPDFEQILNEKPINEVDKYYIIGYREAAKKKRIKNGILGAGAGVISAIAVSFLL